MSPEQIGGTRLQKVLAQAGVASRRRCEDLMVAGRVVVNGEVATQLGRRVDPAVDVIHVDGRRLPPPSDNVYLVLNKPSGVVSTMHDPQGRTSLTDLLGDRPERLFHVGRLDTDTSGLLLLTNDGDFAQQMAHPSYEISKTYVAQVGGVVKPGVRRRLMSGVELDDGSATVDRFKVLEVRDDRSLVELQLHSGRNRVVRRLMDAVGHPVEELTRTEFGSVRLDGLRPGATRRLGTQELGVLLDSVDL